MSAEDTLVPDGAQLAYPARTTEIKDQRTGLVVGTRHEEVYDLVAIPSAELEIKNPRRFDFHEAAVRGDKQLPAYWQSRPGGVDVFLRDGIVPADVIRGRAQIRVVRTTNLYTEQIEGEDGVRDDSVNEYLRITFTPALTEGTEVKRLVISSTELPEGSYEDAFGWATNNAGVFIGVKPIEKAEPFNPVVAAPADPA